MAEIVIIYRDLKAEHRHGYEIQQLYSDSMLLKEQIFPGMFGAPDLYIRHLTLTWAKKRILIIAQTDSEIAPAEGIEILAGAVEFLERQ